MGLLILHNRKSVENRTTMQHAFARNLGRRRNATRDVLEGIKVNLLVLTTANQLPGEVVVVATWDHLRAV